MKEIIKFVILYIIDLPKILYINYKCLPISQAIKLPIRINHKVKLENLKRNSIIIDCTKITFSMINIGYSGCKFVNENKMYIGVNNNGKITFLGKIKISEGVNIYSDGGNIIFGKNVYINRNLLIQSNNKITIKDNCLIGWNVNIRDTDGHKTKSNSGNCEIIIGERTWISSDVTILKSTKIGNNSIVGCNSLVCRFQAKKDNILIAGHPAKEIKENIEWEE